jgi:ketosteroid isomerase-like protein
MGGDARRTSARRDPLNPDIQGVMNMDDREEKIQWLLDCEEIRACLHRYTRGVDRHDTELVLSAFHDDALATYGSFEGGPAEVARWANSGHEASFIAHQHRVSNLSIDIDGDVAHTEAYYEIVLTRKDRATSDVLFGRYIDRCERRDGTWKIARRVCIMDWTGEFTANAERARRQQTYQTGHWDRTDISYERPLRDASLRVPER